MLTKISIPIINKLWEEFIGYRAWHIPENVDDRFKMHIFNKNITVFNDLYDDNVDEIRKWDITEINRVLKRVEGRVLDEE